MSSSLTSINPGALRVNKSSADLINDLTTRMSQTKLVSGGGDDVEGTHIEAPGRYIKHPLQNAWTLWFFKNDKFRSWEENQRPIITVTTVEDFWSLYNHIEVASKLPTGADYSLFKEGIFPDWEDPRNQEGGRWIINLDKKHREGILDTYWLEVLFFLIGEHADQHAFQVNGAVVNMRMKMDKIAIWLADASQSESIMAIGKTLKEKLVILDVTTTIGFNVHQDEKAMSRPNFGNKHKFQV